MEAHNGEHCADDKHHDAQYSSHLVVVVFLRQAEQPGNQQVDLLGVGLGQLLVVRDKHVLGQQVNNVEVVDVLDKVRDERRSLHAEQVGQLDAEEHLNRVRTVYAGGLDHVGGNVH